MKPRVSKGDRLKCIDPRTGLTEGAVYEAITDEYDEYGERKVTVINDNGTRSDVFRRRFQVLPRAEEDELGRPPDLLGDAIRRAYQEGTVESTKKPYQPESFVGRTDIDWSRLIKEGGQS